MWLVFTKWPPSYGGNLLNELFQDNFTNCEDKPTCADEGPVTFSYEPGPVELQPLMHILYSKSRLSSIARLATFRITHFIKPPFHLKAISVHSCLNQYSSSLQLSPNTVCVLPSTLGTDAYNKNLKMCTSWWGYIYKITMYLPNKGPSRLFKWIVTVIS